MPKECKTIPISVRKTLRQSGLKAKKGLGQHFLVDSTVLETIISTAEISPQDIIVEVGPGPGILTLELAKRAGKVIAVEVDSALVSRLKRKLSSFSNISIINADILKVNLSELIAVSSYKVVANLPYYITSPILHYFVGTSPKPSLMVVMMQKEVGEAIVAGPGKMTVLGATMQVYTRPKIISYVPSESFYPPPKIDSVIVRFDFLAEPAVNATDIDNFLAFVRSGFRSPRKQLRNSLAQGLGIKPDEAAMLLAEAGVNPQHRPEKLSLKEWLKLYQVTLATDTLRMS